MSENERPGVGDPHEDVASQTPFARGRHTYKARSNRLTALRFVTDVGDCGHGHREVLHVAPAHFAGPACPECSDAAYADEQQRVSPCPICAALAEADA
jgi:hypothetical protein